MFTQKPCLPVHTPQKRKRRAQSTSVQVDSVHDDEKLTDGDDVESNEDNIDSDHDMNAASYLYSVREEARLLPDIWTSKTPTKEANRQQITADSISSCASSNTDTNSSSKKICDTSFHITLGSIASLQYLTSDRTKIYPPPTLYHIPYAAKAWVDQSLADFSKLRLYLERCKGNINNGPSERQPVPPMKDFMAWYTFCIGRNHGFPTDNTVVTSTVTQPPSDTPTPDWEINLPSNGRGYTPSVRLLLQMDQVMVRRVLLHLTNYVERVCGDNRQYNCYLWIYALLARLEKPIHRDDAVTLFTLLKRLTLLRYQIPESALSADPMNTVSVANHDLTVTKTHNFSVDSEPFNQWFDCQYLATLNMLIVVIGVYFEQGGNYEQIMEVPSLP